jgi:VWFA-related protein
MMAERTRVLAVALTVAVALLAVPAAQDQLPLPTFRTEANYVRVDAFPTRDGSAVADLTAADFEVFEDRAPQKIEQFERVVIRAAGSAEGRREPNTVAESRQAVQDPRARVFVLFLDPAHVELGTSRQISQTLVNFLNRLVGPDDYVGLMAPPMRGRDVTFGRRTVVIESLLNKEWWGRRDEMVFRDPVEQTYAFCYPAVPNQDGSPPSDRGIAQEMILRRREQQTFDALEDLVGSLRNVREERKAVIAITDGWLLYRPNGSLTRPLDNAQPPVPVLGVDPRNGRLTPNDPKDAGGSADRRACERDREALSHIDDEERLRTIIDEANRSNTSFYPVDPRGLTVFDEGIVPSAGVGIGQAANPTLSPQQEGSRLTARSQTLRRLAEGTDGTAVVGTNNIAPALRRVVDDLSSYYLLGYYSTGKLDGKFHSISVRVKRPGVSVRARRGYQALREADVARAVAPRTAAPAASAADAAIATAVSSAVAKIVNSARDLPLRVHVTAGWRSGADGRPEAMFWTVGEVVDRIPGSDLECVLMTAAGEIVTSVRGRIVPGTTSAIVTLMPGQAVQGGDYVVRVRSQSPAGTETVSMPVILPAASQSSGAVFIRRGPSTGNKEIPTADLRFRRSERLRVEVPATADVAGARLLDRTGKPLAIPVAAATRTDADGSRWATGELVLAPLAPADYVVEISVSGIRTMAAFRVVP